MSTSDNPTSPTDRRSASNSEAQQSAITPPPSSEEEQPRPPEEEQPRPPEEKSPPWNLVFAIVALGVALVAFLAALLIFRGLFEDPAVVTGALGALFTLIGTVAGAYFGIKTSSDMADRAKKQVDEANARTERAHKSAEAALGALNSGKFENLRKEGVL